MQRPRRAVSVMKEGTKSRADFSCISWVNHIYYVAIMWKLYDSIGFRYVVIERNIVQRIICILNKLPSVCCYYQQIGNGIFQCRKTV